MEDWLVKTRDVVAKEYGMDDSYLYVFAKFFKISISFVDENLSSHVKVSNFKLKIVCKVSTACKYVRLGRD